MTFSDPVESLNPHSTALREWEPRAPAGLKPVIIEAADALDNQQRQIEDCAASQRLVKGWIREWMVDLELSTWVHVGQMDSDSRAQEKIRDAQQKVQDVIRKMREVL